MNQRTETKQGTAIEDLQSDRTALQACLRAYDRLIASYEAGQDQSIVVPEGLDRSPAITKVRNLTTQLDDVGLAAAQRRITTFGWLFGFCSFKRCAMAMLVIGVATVAAWWMYHRPTQLAAAQVQGVWQQFDVSLAGETGKNYYRTFTASEMATSDHIEPERKLHGYSRRFELTPATGFYLLEITNLPGGRPIAGAQFYVQIRDEKMYELRGIHRMDPIRVPAINLWRPAKSVPTGPAVQPGDIPAVDWDN